MYTDYVNVSQDFLDEQQADGRTFKAKLVPVNCGQIISDEIFKISYRGQIGSSSENFELGTANASQIEVSMEDTGIEVKNMEFTWFIGLVLPEESENEIEWIQIGIFVAEKPERKDGRIDFVAYDYMATKLNDVYYSELTYPCDIEDICIEIQQKTGVQFFPETLPYGITVNLMIESNDGVTVTYKPPLDGYTYREAIAIIASRLLKFAVVNRFGYVEFKWFKSAGIETLVDENSNVLLNENENILVIDAPLEINQNDYYTNAHFLDDRYKIGYAQVSIGNDEGTVIRVGNGNCGVTVNGVLYSNANELEEQFQNIEDFAFTPLNNLSFKGNLLIDLGDILRIQTVDNMVYRIPVTYLDFTFDGGLKTTIASIAGNEQTEQHQLSPMEKQIARIVQKLAVVENLMVTKQITVGNVVGLEDYKENMLDGSLLLDSDMYEIGEVG